MNISRREKYSNLGNKKNIIKGNIEKVNFKFDLYAFQLMCCYVLSTNRNITRGHLISLRNLMEIMDETPFQNDPEKIKRISFIKRGLEGKIDKNLRDPRLLVKYIYGGLAENTELSQNQLDYELNSEELTWINETVATGLKYAFINNNIDRIIELATLFKTSDYKNMEDIVRQIEDWVDETKTKFRRTRIDTTNSSMFSLRDGYFENMVKDIHELISNDSAGVQTGIQGINELIGGKFQNGRCYLFLGASGMGKSLTLLNLAVQIKKYNKHYQTKDPTKRPCVVLLTMENFITEIVDTLFNTSTVGDQMKTFSAEDAIKMMREDGELYLNDESPVDIIIKYIPNGSVDTSYLYTLTEELEDDGYECICMIQDYVKRIRSVYKANGDIRIEFGEVINEFKTFAMIKDIPMITAGQLNRDGSNKLEDGKLNNKTDLIRYLGRAQVGESMLMIDNSDVCFVLDREYDSQGNLYMGLKRIKERYRIVSPRSLLFLPYVKGNGAKLLEDFNLSVPTARDTLKEGIADMSNFNNGSSKIIPSPYRQETKDIDEIIAERRQILTDDNVFVLDKYRKNILPTELPELKLINPMKFAI